MKLRKLILVFILLLGISENSFGQGLPKVDSESLGLSSKRLSRIESMLQDHINKEELAGAVALVARHGKIAYLKAFGMMDIEKEKPMKTDAIFRIASMTKLITSVGAMILYEEDHFSLNDPVSKYIPEYKNLQVAMPPLVETEIKHRRKLVPMDREITIRDLLRHTSGLSYGFGFNHVDSLYQKAIPESYNGSLKDLVLDLTKLPLAYQPGTKWEYSFSTDVLGHLIELITCESFDTFIEKRILKPLGMKDTGFWIPFSKKSRLSNVYTWTENGLELEEKAEESPFLKRPKLLSGGGGLVSTASDYARFLQMLLNGGHINGKRLLSKKTIELMFTNHLKGIDRNWLSPGYSFGLGVSILMDVGQNGELGSPGLFRWAGIYNTFFFVDPMEEMFGILMTQMSPFVLHQFNNRFKKLCMQAIVD